MHLEAKLEMPKYQLKCILRTKLDYLPQIFITRPFTTISQLLGFCDHLSRRTGRSLSTAENAMQHTKVDGAVTQSGPYPPDIK